MLLKKRNSIWVLFGLLVIVLSLRQIREPDLWWQMTTGNYILENKEVPKTDVFSFSFEGTEWINVKWGSEVLQALVAKVIGVEFLPLLQALFSLLTIFWVYKIYRTQTQNTESKNGHLYFIVVATLALFVVAFRMNSRPEMASHLFAFLFIGILEMVRKGQFKWVYALVPLQLIWANMHEAYGMGMVITGFYLLAFWWERKTLFHQKRITSKQLQILSGLIIISWLIVGIHPMGLQMIWHPYNIFTQLSNNQFTSELFSWKFKEYWSFSSYLNMLFFIAGTIYLYKLYKKKTLFKLYGPAYLLLYFAFFYLSISSFRNIPFFIWVAVPVLAKWLLALIPNFNTKRFAIGLTGGLVLLYLLVVSNKFYETVLPREKYGLKIKPENNAIGLSNFMKKNNVKGQGFTDYMISSYMLWELRPDFKTFIDLRDLDIYNASFISTVLRCLTHPEDKIGSGEKIWDYLDSRAKFDFVAMNTNPQFVPLHRYLEKNGVYTLAYEDQISRLYIRKDGANTALLGKGFKKFGSNTYLENAPENKAATWVSKFFWLGY